MLDEVTRLLDDQVAYYRARATEYDATSSADGDPYAPAADLGREAMRAFARGGRVIEIAAGTGQWTGLLADAAADLLVTDSAPEMLALNRLKTGERPHVRYRVVDAFALEPTHDRDAVVIGFFLSHVPPARFEPFWGVVEGLLAPGGRTFFIDEAFPGVSTEDWIDREAGVTRRRLRDGTTHRAVKVLWQPADLEARLRELGWEASVRSVAPFYWGTASR
jgi:demethylmenaquinone methyltransferase/2-methoxy-6-polyprenyl-1,4-benzoquinol methylase